MPKAVIKSNWILLGSLTAIALGFAYCGVPGGSDSSDKPASDAASSAPAKLGCHTSGNFGGYVKAEAVKSGKDTQVNLSYKSKKPVSQYMFNTDAGSKTVAVSPAGTSGALETRTIKDDTGANTITLTLMTTTGAKGTCEVTIQPAG